MDDDTGELIVCGGGAEPGDGHLLGRVVAIDEEIIDYLKWLAAPIGFTDTQLDLLLAAAAPLPRPRRDGFLRAVAAGLDCEPEDDEVREAITTAGC